MALNHHAITMRITRLIVKNPYFIGALGGIRTPTHTQTGSRPGRACVISVLISYLGDRLGGSARETGSLAVALGRASVSALRHHATPLINEHWHTNM
jgi:hypothetical protein